MSIKQLFLFFLLLLALPCALLSQERLAKLKKANDLYLKKQYTQAIVEYEDLMSSSTGAAIMGVDSRLQLADSYRQTGQAVKAEPLYKDLQNEAEDYPEVLLFYGETLMGIGKLDEAMEKFTAFSAKRPDDPRGAALVEQCRLIQAIRPLYFDVKITREEVANTPASEEFGLNYYGNGIVFASNQIAKTTDNWKNIASIDMFYSEISAENSLLAPRLLSKRLNTPQQQEGPASFTRDGKTIYYARSVKPTQGAPEGTRPVQIVSAKNESGKWSKPEVLPFNIADLVFTHPCLSADGTQLFFTSNMPNGGQGGLDIWVCTFRGGKWSQPRNMGPTVNTPKDDAFPFLHPDGTLYFASKGHGNYGGYDLFRALPVGNGIDWQKAENIGQPINSAFDDTYFLLSDDQTKGFLVSNRDGSDDIYQFILTGETAKPLPPNISPRAAAIFNDSADVEGLIVDNPNTRPNNPSDAENRVDSLLKNGGLVVEDPKKTNPDGTKPDGTKTNPDGTKTNPDIVKTDGNKDNNNPDNPDTNPDNPDTNPDNPDGNPDVVKTDGTDPKKGGNKPSKGGNKPEKPKKEPLELVVEIQIIDANSKDPLDQSIVSLRNAKTGKEEPLEVSGGIVRLTLQPDQKYEVIANCSGYYGGRMPITTTGAYKSERAEALFPLLKHEQ